jgi:hypothetical protein
MFGGGLGLEEGLFGLLLEEVVLVEEVFIIFEEEALLVYF